MAKNDITVVIEIIKAMPKTGFGIPLIIAGMQADAIPYKKVGSLPEIIKAGFAEDSAVYKAAELLFMQAEAPKKIAVCASTENVVATLPGILAEEWRQLIVVSTGVENESTIEAISNYIEASKKHAMYFAAVDPDADAAMITAITENERTFLVAYTSTDVANPEAAIVGATAGRAAGSFTYKNMILKGVTPQDYTDAEVDTLHEQGVITILRKAGDIVTTEGVVVCGEYADIVDSKDYIIQQIEGQCQSLLNRVPKLPYDNRGIAALEGVVVSVLKDAANNGMIAQTDDGDYEYSTTFLPRSECDPVDISARVYNGGNFEFTLAGAIHYGKISGTIIA